MEPAFWRERWANNEIGFHLPMVNPRLIDCWPRLALPAASRVLVPLAGKSLDLLWLRDQGHAVVAVELCETAAGAFFDEAGLSPQRHESPGFVRYTAPGIDYRVGDFFALAPAALGPFAAVWDRGALVALPAPLRQRYAAHLARLCQSGTQILLMVLDYAQAEMSGPPFAVPAAEVHALFGAGYTIEGWLSEDILDLEPRFRARGVTALDSCVYGLRKS
ncbi:MAG: thiopurine S-methyltransferase [Gammaproteobacteria bacterium]|nr:thiopurine S-methyltransferase [Gammaproteobacteria bacterium]